MNRKAIAESLDRAPRRATSAPPAAPAATSPAPPRRATSAPPAAPAATSPAPAGRADRKTRLTFDLVGAEARDFANWRGIAADELSRSRVTAQDVCRLLVRQLLADPQLQAAVLQALADEQAATL